MEQYSSKINDINCILTIESDEAFVFPLNRLDSSSLYEYISKQKTNIRIYYDHPIFKKSFLSIKKILSWDFSIIKLSIEYYFNCLEDDYIHSFELSGDQLDWFFNPLDYYFRLKSNNGKMPEDLLYNSEIVKKYSFKFERQEIKVEVSFGEILKKGVLSDLQIHAQLKVMFNETNNFDFIYRVYLIIVKFINIVSYQTNFNHKKVELFGKSKSSEQSLKGYLKVKKYSVTPPDNHVSNLLRTWDPYIESLFELIVKDKNISVHHLPQDRYTIYKTRISRFSSIFAAFEVEFKKQYNNRVSDETKNNLLNIKDSFNKYLNERLTSSQSSDEKWFINEVKKRADQIGLSKGQSAKLKIAYEDNIEIFSNSFNFSKEKGFLFNQTMNKINKLRGLIVHENYIPSDIDNYEKHVLFIEILTLILFLRRLKMNSSEIEKVIGNIFMDNDHFMD